MTTSDAAKEPIVRKRGDSWKKKRNQIKLDSERMIDVNNGEYGIACVMPPDIVCMDIDKFKHLKPINKECGINLLDTTLCVKSGRGYHIYYKKPDPDKVPFTGLKKKVDLFRDTDFRKNGFMIMPPSTHYLGGRYEWIENGYKKPADMPKELFKVLKRIYKNLNLTGGKNYVRNSQVGDLKTTKGKPFLSHEDLKTALDSLDPTQFTDMENEFQPLILAVHSTMLGCEKAREIFIEWAASDDLYDTKVHIDANRRMWNNAKL